MYLLYHVNHFIIDNMLNKWQMAVRTVCCAGSKKSKLFKMRCRYDISFISYFIHVSYPYFNINIIDTLLRAREGEICGVLFKIKLCFIICFSHESINCNNIFKFDRALTAPSCTNILAYLFMRQLCNTPLAFLIYYKGSHIENITWHGGAGSWSQIGLLRFCPDSPTYAAFSCYVSAHSCC